MKIETVKDLEKYLAKIEDKDLPIFINVLYCEEDTDERGKRTLDNAKWHRHSINEIAKTKGPLYDGEEDILASWPGVGIDMKIYQNESLRVH